ncbi:sulfurtransferase TusA family protein [Vibrio makurazakiensis]|uniref:sulfurtransferase TusA family protein n=1 Tax=Vibrio makurazakiensis TaxID=2910250 RepID=UPI003D0EC26B
MEPNILDLRTERCPMALLLAKRHTAKLEVGQSLDIYISDKSSMQDTMNFLSRHSFSVDSEANLDYFHLKVIKKELQSNA